MPEWGTQPANHYLPRRTTRMRIHEDELVRADNPLRVEGHLPKPADDARRRSDDAQPDPGQARQPSAMHPAFSVIFLTTLIGAGQGLFLALFTAQIYALAGPAAAGRSAGPSTSRAALLALVLLVAGLVASFFHLGHPERAWRAAAQWRTSWLSREVIVLPAFMALVALYGLAHATGLEPALAHAGRPGDRREPGPRRARHRARLRAVRLHRR